MWVVRGESHVYLKVPVGEHGESLIRLEVLCAEVDYRERGGGGEGGGRVRGVRGGRWGGKNVVSSRA